MTTTMTLADLAATSLSAIRILEQHGLDYCCGGQKSLAEACGAAGLHTAIETSGYAPWSAMAFAPRSGCASTIEPQDAVAR